MGNRILCSEGSFRCTERCTRITIGDRADAAMVTGGRPQNRCDPAGAIFDDTLAELNDIDRQLLLFASTAHLAAVRWLLVLGASRHARDSNATTCLHAVCRSGCAAVAEALLRLDAEVDFPDRAVHATDVAGWTALHIAAFMGRFDIAVILVQHGAPIGQKNLAGHYPVDLCSDGRTREFLMCQQHQIATVMPVPGVPSASAGGGGPAPSPPVQHNPDTSVGAFAAADEVCLDADGDSDLKPLPQASQDGKARSQAVRFEPFFVPRVALIHEHDRSPEDTHELFALGKDIFNRQPGRGLAFLVAAGALRDYPVDLVAFLRSGGLNPQKIGTFLGEDFSLSKILRMEFLNTVNLLHVGVVTCLQRAFLSLGAPTDLQKVDRILSSLAEVWWRHHHRFGISLSGSGALPQVVGDSDDMPPFAGRSKINHNNQGEPRGFELKRLLPNPGVLRQLLFSTMLLHWNAHAPLPRSQKLSLLAWLDLHRGIMWAGSGGATIDGTGDIPDKLLVPIYRSIFDRPETPNLQLGGPTQHVETWQTARLTQPASGPTSTSNRGVHCSSDEIHDPVPAWAEDDGSAGTDEMASAAALAFAPVAQERACSAVMKYADIEGWVRVIGDGLPAPLSAYRGDGYAGGRDASASASADCLKMAGILSEATASSRRLRRDHTHLDPQIEASSVTPTAALSRRSGMGDHVMPAVLVAPCSFATGMCAAHSPADVHVSLGASSPKLQLRGIQGDASEWHGDGPSVGAIAAEVVDCLRPPNAPDAVWLSLCRNFIFLSAEPSAECSPFAFVYLRFPAGVASVEPLRSTFAIDGGPDSSGEAAPPKSDVPHRSVVSASNLPPPSPPRRPLQLVFLLPDGKWHAFEVPRLVVEVCDRAQLEAWTFRLDHERLSFIAGGGRGAVTRQSAEPKLVDSGLRPSPPSSSLGPAAPLLPEKPGTDKGIESFQRFSV